MVRGLIFGIIWGGLFTALFLAVVSMVSPMPDRKAQGAMVSGVEPMPVVSAPGVMPDDEVTPTPQMSSPSIEDAPSVGDTTSAIMPTHGDAESDLVSVAEGNETVPSLTPGDAPTVAAVVAAPTAPNADMEPSVSADSAQPVMLSMDGDENLAAGSEDQSIAPLATESDGITLAPDAPLNNDNSVVVKQLPTMSSTTDTPQPMDQPTVAEAAQDDRPLMAIVLIDTGEYNFGPEALASFPYPISFAIDPLRDDAIAAAEKYRSKGYELLLTADLPQDGDRSLAQIALTPTLESFGDVAGLLEGTGSGLQGNMGLSEGVLDMLEGSNYGLVLRSKGLNAAQQQADGRGLPVDTVFRDFDANGQDATVIRRFLDQAAFKARQSGEVIMVGRLRPTTISALLLWGLQDRASSVRLTTVSEVLNHH